MQCKAIYKQGKDYSFVYYVPTLCEQAWPSNYTNNVYLNAGFKTMLTRLPIVSK